MRILHVTAAYTPFLGGATTYLAELSRRFAVEGHDVTVLTTDIAEVDRIWSPRGKRVDSESDVIDGARVARFRTGHLPLAPYSFYVFRRFMPALAHAVPSLAGALGGWVPRLRQTQATRRALDQRYDLVHVCNITLESVVLVGARLARDQRIPLICTPFVHVGQGAILRNYVMPHQLEVMRKSRVVFVQGEREAQTLNALAVDPARTRVLGMGVNPGDAQGADGARFRRAYGIAHDVPLVLFAGSLTVDKGAVALLHAMRTLWSQGAQAHVAFLGLAPGPGGFEHAYAALTPAEQRNVTRAGVVAEPAKHDAFAACTVFSMPSRVDSFGIVYLEAWLHGKPVIGANAGGVPDVIADGVDGLLVPFGDAQALAQAFSRLFSNAGLRAAMGAAGRAKLERLYTWDIVFAKVAQAYQNAV